MIRIIRDEMQCVISYVVYRTCFMMLAEYLYKMQKYVRKWRTFHHRGSIFQSSFHLSINVIINYISVMITALLPLTVSSTSKCQTRLSNMGLTNVQIPTSYSFKRELSSHFVNFHEVLLIIAVFCDFCYLFILLIKIHCKNYLCICSVIVFF